MALHPPYLSLRRDPDERANAYRSWLHSSVSKDDLVAIRTHIVQERGWVTRASSFQCILKCALNRPVGCRPRGRPK